MSVKKEQEELYLMDRCLYYLRSKDKIIQNNKLDALINELNQKAKEEWGTQYTEEIITVFPIKLSEGTMIVLAPKDKPVKDKIGIEHCDVLIYNVDNQTYSKISTKYGITEIFSKEGIPTANCLMDNLLVTQVKETCMLELDSTFNMYLYLLPEEKLIYEIPTIKEMEMKIEEKFNYFQLFNK